MKDWQFWTLITIIIIQSVFITMKFKSIEEQQAKTYTEIILNAEDLTHIKNTTDFIQEITAKHINGID